MPGPTIILNQSYPGFRVGEPFEIQMAAQTVTAVTAWNLYNHPSGMSINSSGKISGTISIQGRWTFQLTATDASGTCAPVNWFIAADGVAQSTSVYREVWVDVGSHDVYFTDPTIAGSTTSGTVTQLPYAKGGDTEPWRVRFVRGALKVDMGTVKFMALVLKGAEPDEVMLEVSDRIIGTFTAATDDVITAAAHGLSNGDRVRVSSSGTLPAGLSANTDYYVRDEAADTFKVSTTLGGGAVNITDTGSGIHSLYHADWVHTNTGTAGYHDAKVTYSSDILDDAHSVNERDSGTEVEVLAEIETVYDLGSLTDLRLTSKTFKLRIERDLSAN